MKIQSAFYQNILLFYLIWLLDLQMSQIDRAIALDSDGLVQNFAVSLPVIPSLWAFIFMSVVVKNKWVRVLWNV